MTSAVLIVLIMLTAEVLSSQPNIIVIIADDMGWNDVGFHGSNQIPTPNMDALAYHGIILNRHYTMPTCTPSRAAYLTGRYPIRTGMQGSPLEAGEPRGIPLSETLLPERLQQLGYVTRLVGKWHVGTFMTDYTPTRRGFHSHLGYWNGYIGYFDHSIESVTPLKKLSGHDFHQDLRPAWELRGQYATDIFTQEAVRLINIHNTSKPLYLHVAHLAVHSGNVSTPLEVLDPAATDARFQHIQDPRRRLYAGMLTSLDESVGMLVAALEDKGILNNSIILFMSDNGAPTHGEYENTGSNWPLRGIKATQYEGGVRGVCNIWSPVFRDYGTVSSQLVHISDWFPTLYTAAGGNISELGDIDGVDQWASLLDQTGVSPPRTQLLVNIDDVTGAEAYIDGDWKLVRRPRGGDSYEGYYGESGEEGQYDVEGVLLSRTSAALSRASGTYLDDVAVLATRAMAAVNCSGPPPISPPTCEPSCLFHLGQDTCESLDVASEHEDVVLALAGHLDRQRAVMLPQTNKPIDPRSDPDFFGGSWEPWLDVQPLRASSTTTRAPPLLMVAVVATFLLNHMSGRS